MYTKTVIFVVLSILAIEASSEGGGTCVDPVVEDMKSFSTKDATIVSQIGFAGEFTLKCTNSAKDPSLFAEFDGKVTPVAHVGPRTYQISWNEDIKRSHSRDFTVRLFDEEGYANIRKAQRAGNDLQSVKALTEFTLSYPGAYKGPWVNSELVGAAAIGFVAYFACTAKNKILS